LPPATPPSAAAGVGGGKGTGSSAANTAAASAVGAAADTAGTAGIGGASVDMSSEAHSHPPTSVPPPLTSSRLSSLTAAVKGLATLSTGPTLIRCVPTHGCMHARTHPPTPSILKYYTANFF
jgi:hypothetical protein